ncbi:MAG: DUF4149 domain-containing protein [Cyanobacteriota bacterium]|nr:DUF4149 domain-containing protein [Cyanobacteriota bacterium]
MNAASSNPSDRINWQVIVLFALGFWLSGSLLLDFVIVPSLFATGMMSQAGFASAGYSLFGLFNRIELVCAALVLTGFLALNRRHLLSGHRERRTIILSALLLAIAIIYTYIFTPQMSSLGLQLNWFESNNVAMSPAMAQMHGAYWCLELLKFVSGVLLLRWCYRDSCTLMG